VKLGAGSVGYIEEEIEQWLSGEDDLDAGLAYLRDHCDRIGRDIPPDLHLSGLATIAPDYNPQEIVDRIGANRTKGVQAVSIMISTNQRSAWCQLAQDFGDRVIANLD